MKYNIGDIFEGSNGEKIQIIARHRHVAGFINEPIYEAKVIEWNGFARYLDTMISESSLKCTYKYITPNIKKSKHPLTNIFK